MKQDSHRKELLKKFLNDQCTPEELEALLDDLSQGGHRALNEEVLEEAWMKLEEYREFDQSRSEAIFSRIITASPTSNLEKKLFQWPVVYKMAAVFIGFLLVAGITFWLFQEDTVIYSTDYGQIQTIQLPDGSQATLNGNSTLQYVRQWEDNDELLPTREIWLEGEAFFEVEDMILPDQGKAKFIVHTPQLDIEVVGTTFNVRNRQDQTQVVLNSGKVKLHLPATGQQVQRADTIWMNPGELVAFSEKHQIIEQRVVTSELYSSWKDHELIFVDTPIREIAEMLEDTYGFHVIIESDSIKDKRFNGTVSTDQVDLLLKALTTTFNINIQQEDHRIIMKNK